MSRDPGHAFVGDGPYCRAWLGPSVIGNDHDGMISMRSQCGYPLDAHPAEATLIDAAIRAGAQAERERIVAWLRGLKSRHGIINIEFAAQMIEKGV